MSTAPMPPCPDFDEEIARQKRKEMAAKANFVSFAMPNLKIAETTIGEAIDFCFTEGQQRDASIAIQALKISEQLCADLTKVLVHICRLVRDSTIDCVPSETAADWLRSASGDPGVGSHAPARAMYLAKVAKTMAEHAGYLEQVTYVAEKLARNENTSCKNMWVKWLQWCASVLPLCTQPMGDLDDLKRLASFPTGELKLADTNARREAGMSPWITGSEVHKELRMRQIAANGHFNSDGSAVWNWVSEVRFREVVVSCESDPDQTLQRAIRTEWALFDEDQQLKWMNAADAYNQQTIKDNKGTPFKPRSAYHIFCEQWPRIVEYTTGFAGDGTLLKPAGWSSCNLDDGCLLAMWNQMSTDTRATHGDMAKDRNRWQFLEEHGERETWERNPFRHQLTSLGKEGLLKAAQTAKELQAALPDSSPEEAIATLAQIFKEQGIGLDPDPTSPKLDGSQVEPTPENIAEGFKDADEYEAVRPDDHWPDWMTYIPKEHRHLACKDDKKLFRLAIKHVPCEHPCYQGILDTLRKSEANDVSIVDCLQDIVGMGEYEGFDEALDTNHAPMDDDFVVSNWTKDAIEGHLGSKYKGAFDKGWIASWKIGVTHPDRIAEWSRNALPHETWKMPRIASEVVMTPEALPGGGTLHWTDLIDESAVRAHTDKRYTYTIAATIGKEWLKEHPPPSALTLSNAEWVSWFKTTWLPKLVAYHYQSIEMRAAAVERLVKHEQDVAKHEQAARDADEAANALLDEEYHERCAAESKKATKARKRQEAAARQAEEGKRAKEAAAAQKREQEATRQAKIEEKRVAHERALEEKKAAEKREQEARFAKVLADKQAQEAKKAQEAVAAQRQAFANHRREMACDALMARLGIEDAPPPVPSPKQPRGRAIRRGRGGRGGRGVGDAPPPPPPTTEEDDKLCVVCLDSEKTQVCVPCGHRCLCAACAETNKPDKCPICRADVAVVVFMKGVFD